MTFIFIKKKRVFAVFISSLILLCSWFYLQPKIIPTITTTSEQEYVINITTGELTSKTDDGKEIESYFWNPGTVYVPQGKEVTFIIYGVNGNEHSFYVEGTNIKGTVSKGEEISVKTSFDKEGM